MKSTRVVARNLSKEGFARKLTLYLSSNGGAVWTQASNAPSANWSSVASSADGAKLIAAAENLGVFTSANSGVNWTHRTNGLPLQNYGAIYLASSADGTKLVAAFAGTAGIFTSTNSGITWTQATNAPLTTWYSVASSVDGRILLGCTYSYWNGGNVYVSTNFGANWTQSDLPVNYWESVAESADGTKMVALASSDNYDYGYGNGGIYTSTDSGATWASNNALNWTWICAAMSADGNEVIAAIGNPAFGGIYVSQPTPAPVLNLSASDSVISWLIPSLAFTLQQSSDLLHWTAVTNPPVLNLTNLQNHVAVPPLGGNDIYRPIH